MKTFLQLVVLGLSLSTMSVCASGTENLFGEGRGRGRVKSVPFVQGADTSRASPRAFPLRPSTPKPPEEMSPNAANRFELVLCLASKFPIEPNQCLDALTRDKNRKREVSARINPWLDEEEQLKLKEERLTVLLADLLVKTSMTEARLKRCDGRLRQIESDLSCCEDDRIGELNASYDFLLGRIKEHEKRLALQKRSLFKIQGELDILRRKLPDAEMSDSSEHVILGKQYDDRINGLRIAKVKRAWNELLARAKAERDQIERLRVQDELNRQELIRPVNAPITEISVNTQPPQVVTPRKQTGLSAKERRLLKRL